MDPKTIDVRVDKGRILRVTRGEHKGREVVDIRLCYPLSANFYRATPVGLIMSAEQAEGLRQALGEVLAEEAMSEEGTRRE